MNIKERKNPMFNPMEQTSTKCFLKEYGTIIISFNLESPL